MVKIVADIRGLGVPSTALVVAMVIAVIPAAAVTCAEDNVSAQGEPASFQWLARIKAIGNWRSKVRQMPELGARYDDWRKGKDPVERCVTNTGSVVCTVTATPCRS